MTIGRIPSLCLVLCYGATATGGDWPQFRGPEGSGVSADKGVPTEVGPAQNVIWKTPLPPGHSSPVLNGPNIFLTAYEGRTLLTIALDRATGKIRWKQPAPRPRMEYMQEVNSPASPSPVSDGKNVYVFFGDFGIICYSIDGEERWKIPLGPFNNPNGHGTSPILADDLLILICDQDTDAYLLALDKASGRVRYKIPRPEVTRGYAVPGVYRPARGPAELIVPGSYYITGYNLASGEKLWWARGMAWQVKGVPLIDGDVIYMNGWDVGGDSPAETLAFGDALVKYDANKDGLISAQEIQTVFRNFGEYELNRDGLMDEREWNFYRARTGSANNLMAVRAGGRGDVTDTHVLWRYRKSLPYVPSPLLYQNVLYLVKDGGVVTTLNPKTGEPHQVGRLPKSMEHYWASPVAADGKVYMLSEGCKLTVLKAGPKLEILATNDLDDGCFATPAIADSRIYLRTRSALYCFGKKG